MFESNDEIIVQRRLFRLQSARGGCLTFMETMKSLRRVGLAAAALVLASGAYGQIGRVWTFDELAKKADAIVVGEARQTIETARTTHPELKPGFPVVQWETSFRVLTIFKGAEQVGAMIRLKHFSPDWSHIQGGLINGGGSLTVAAGQDYLLFLARRDADLYEPVSGQTFPGQSLKEVPPADR